MNGLEDQGVHSSKQVPVPIRRWALTHESEEGIQPTIERPA